MKFAAIAVFGLSLAFVDAASAAAPASAPAAQAAVSGAVAGAAHVKAVQDLLAAMQAENVLRSVAGRSRYQSTAQRQAVFAKIDKTPAAEVHRRLAPTLVHAISADTALEMTRFYQTPYGKQVIHNKFNSGPQLMMPGAQAAVAPEEKKERKRAAYVLASKQLAEAEPVIEREAFKLLQLINKEAR